MSTGNVHVNFEDQPVESRDTYRFSLDKRVMRIRYENESETHVDLVIEPKEPQQ